MPINAGNVVKWGGRALLLFMLSPFLLICFGCTAGGIFCIVLDRVKASHCTEKLTAEVAEIEKGVFDAGSTGYDIEGAVFRFTYNGKEYLASGKNKSNEKIYTVGEEVTLYINPDDPMEVYCPKDKSALKTGFALLGVSAFIGVIAFFAIYKPRKAAADAVQEFVEVEELRRQGYDTRGSSQYFDDYDAVVDEMSKGDGAE